jgi:hypothetical protein
MLWWLCRVFATNYKVLFMLFKQLLIASISCVLVACAGTAGQGETASEEGSSGANDCIHKPSIRGYNVLDEQNLIVEAGGARHYHVVLQRVARGIRYSTGIVFKSTTSRVCAGFDSVVFGGGIGDSGDIRIASIRELTTEEEEHLLIQYGKKEPEIKQAPVPQEVEGAEVEELDEAASE